MSPDAPLDFTQVKLAGHVAHWVTAVLVLGFFLLLPRFGAHRRLLPAWIAAWSALVVSTFVPAVSSLQYLLGLELLPPGVDIALDLVLLPARFLFLLFVAVAGYQASGRSVRPGALQALVVGVTLVGLFVGTSGNYNHVNQVTALLTPGLFLGMGVLILASVRQRRSNGMMLLATAMGIFAIGTTLFALAPTGLFERFAGLDTATRLIAAESFGSAVLVAILGAAVVVLVVQDSLLLVNETREEQVREASGAEVRLRRIIEAAGDAIVTFDIGHRIVQANAAAGHLFGVPARRLIGRRLDHLVDTSGLAATDDAPRIPSGTGVGHRPDGTTFPAECTIGPFQEDVPRSGGVAIIRDLTAHEAARIERERFERQVAESEKMLAIGRVVSGVAHELNNPLMVVLSQSEQLGFVPLDAETRSNIRLINEQALRARHIVRDLLTFVRPTKLVAAPLDLSAMALDVLGVQAKRAAERGCQLVARVPDGQVVVLGDQLGLEQVLINLVGNAIDAGGPGGIVTVTIDEDDGHAVLGVEDSGPGIAPELVERIFEPFFSTKGVGQGTGLGLAVSRSLVEQQGGVLGLANRPNPSVGARFEVRLATTTAIVEVDPEPAPQAPPVPAPHVVRSAEGTIQSVLIIDDEPAVRKTMRSIFTRWQWPVIELDSATDALRLLTRDEAVGNGLAVVICDLRMPVLTGQELFEQVRQLAPSIARRFIFVTGDVVEPGTAAFLATANQPVVEKPFTLEEMSRAVQAIVERRSVSRN